MKDSTLSASPQNERARIPMLVYRLPGETAFHREEFISSDGSTLFFGNATVTAWEHSPTGYEGPCNDTGTEYEEYTGSLSELVPQLKAEGGKTVICRRICGMFGSDFHPEEMAMEYFAEFPDMFCFLFYHPSTGYWMGASPELLLENVAADTYKTRALAGTMLCDDASPWSRKNIEEHTIVVDDIATRLKALPFSCEITIGERTEMRYAAIKHLLTPISLRCRGVDVPVDDIVSQLHPTPAVGGYPREKALADIEKYEHFGRRYYGGLVKVGTASTTVCYVILRCVNFDDTSWTVYSGSGVTAESSPADEWMETQRKAAPLLEILSRH